MKDLLLRVKNEIDSLRRENQILRAQVGVVNIFGLALRADPSGHSLPASTDVAYELWKESERIEAVAYRSET